MNKAVRRVKDLFFPPRCVLCDEVIARERFPICPHCQKQGVARIEEPVCSRCGRQKNDCVCKKNTLLTDGVVGVFYYDDELVEKGIKRFKKTEDIDRIEYFAEQLMERAYLLMADKQIDLITTVPLYKSDLAKRGFDQMRPVAKWLSKSLHTPYVQVLRKIFPTLPQKGLSADRRSGNLLGVFEVCSKISLKGKNILLLDDVVTTGATTNECAKMLKIYGAAKVYVLTLAVSRLDKDDDKDAVDPIAELKGKLAEKAGNFT